MSNPNRTTFYIGVTNDMRRRAAEHKSKEKKGFTAKYNMIDLVYYEWHDRIVDAIAKEKRLKRWHREWKLNLIRSMNPDMHDLFNELW